MNSFSSMLGCPACGLGPNKITGCTPARSGVDIRRKRTCVKCSTGWVTYEVTAADYAMLQALRKWGRKWRVDNVEILDGGRSGGPAND